jgi:hypothetical protein
MKEHDRLTVLDDAGNVSSRILEFQKVTKEIISD